MAELLNIFFLEFLLKEYIPWSIDAFSLKHYKSESSVYMLHVIYPLGPEHFLCYDNKIIIES